MSDFLPGLLQQVCCVGWAVLLHSSVQLLPHQLTGVQIWWLSWQSYHKEYSSSYFHCPNNKKHNWDECLSCKLKLPAISNWSKEMAFPLGYGEVSILIEDALHMMQIIHSSIAKTSPDNHIGVSEASVMFSWALRLAYCTLCSLLETPPIWIQYTWSQFSKVHCLFIPAHCNLFFQYVSGLFSWNFCPCPTHSVWVHRCLYYWVFVFLDSFWVCPRWIHRCSTSLETPYREIFNFLAVFSKKTILHSQYRLASF